VCSPTSMPLVPVVVVVVVVVVHCCVLIQEQMTGAEYNDKSDVWSVGCILYELSALRPPFHADSHLALVKNITSGHLQRIPARYSDDLFALISALLQVDVSGC